MHKDEGGIKGKNRIHHIKVCFKILQCHHTQNLNSYRFSYKNTNSIGKKCTVAFSPEVALWPIQARLAL